MPLHLSSSRFLLGRRAAPDALPEPVLSGYTPEQIAIAARGWTHRAGQEHHSAAVFADALGFLADADVPLDVPHSLARAVSDELRHTELCVSLATAMGAPAPPNDSLRRNDPLPATRGARRARGLEIVAMQGAVGETLSCDFLLAAHDGTEEPMAKAALNAIRRDEVLHARQCWETLEVVVPLLDDQAKTSLHAHLRFGLGSVEQNIALPAARLVEQGEAFDPALRSLGILPPEERVNAFYGALERRVLPELDRLGLDGKTAWERRFRRENAPRR